MKPGDNPDFFRFAPPPGTSRESTIFLDREGRFWHEGERVEHRKLEQALASWVSRHPDDGRLILTNGYDWCYFRAEDTPFFIEAIRGTDTGQDVRLVLSDETEEPLDPKALSLGSDGVVYAKVKGGAFEARFKRFAQTELAPLLVDGDPPTIRVGAEERVLPPRQTP